LKNWVINFYGPGTVEDAAHYEAPFRRAIIFNKPYRDGIRDAKRLEKWWQFVRSDSNLRSGARGNPVAPGTPNL